MSDKDNNIFNSDINTEEITTRSGEVDVIFLAKGQDHIYYTDETGKVNTVRLEFIMDYNENCPITDRSQLLNAEMDFLAPNPPKASKDYYTLKIDTNSTRQIIPDHLPPNAFQLAQANKENWDILVEDGIIYLLLVKPLFGAIKENPSPTFFSILGNNHVKTQTETNTILGFSIEINNFYLITDTDDESMKTGDVALEIKYSNRIVTETEHQQHPSKHPFDKTIRGLDQIFYKYFEDMKIVPLHPVVRAMGKNEMNRAGILVNNNKENTLVIQLVNVSNEPIVFDKNAKWSLDIPNDSDSPFSITHQKTGFAYTVNIKGPKQNPQQISNPSTNNQFTITLPDAKEIVPYGYLEIKIENFTTNLSPRTSFIKFAYTNAKNFKDSFILIPVTVQPMTMEDRTVLVAANDRKLEITGNNLKLYNNSNKANVDISGDANRGFINIYYQGQKRVYASATDSSGHLLIFNKNEQNNVDIYGDSQSGYVKVFNQGAERGTMATDNSKGYIHLYNKNNQLNHEISGYDNGGRGFINIFYQGQKRVYAAAGENSGRLLIFNKREQDNVDLYGNSQSGYVKVFNQGAERGTIATDNSKGYIHLYNKNNQLNHEISGYDNDGRGFINIFYQGQKRVYAAAGENSGRLYISNKNGQQNVDIYGDYTRGIIRIKKKGENMLYLSDNISMYNPDNNKRNLFIGKTSGNGQFKATLSFQSGRLSLVTNKEKGWINMSKEGGKKKSV